MDNCYSGSLDFDYTRSNRRAISERRYSSYGESGLLGRKYELGLLSVLISPDSGLRLSSDVLSQRRQ